MKKKIKCKVCGVRYNPKHMYEVQESQSALATLSTAPRVFDAMDCPNCGCQKILSVRIPKIENTEEGGTE